jgi:hypothetical protein
MGDRSKEIAALLTQRPSHPSPYAQPDVGQTNTQLPLLDEMAFKQWVAQNNVPFDPKAQQSDYDMRGFWQGMQQQNPRATASINPNDQQMHYPDYWKTPLHQTFSNESKFAGPVAPMWNDQDQLISPGGRILFDERRR